MVDYLLSKYDHYREWIKNARNRGFTWEQIKYANLGNEVELIQFLAFQSEVNFWDSISVSDWYDLVEHFRLEEQGECSREIELVNKEIELFTEEMNNLKEMAKEIKERPEKNLVIQYAMKLKQVDKRIKKSNINSLLKKQLRESLCYSARELSVSMHNEKCETENSLYLFEELLAEFEDMPDWTSKLIEDVKELRKQIALLQQPIIEQQEKEKLARNRGWALAILLLCIVFAVLIMTSGDKTASSVNSRNKETATPVPTATPKPVQVYNGKILVNTDYEQICPFEVSVDTEHDFYVLLEYQKAPNNSIVSRELKNNAMAPYEGDVAFYVKAGKTVNINVPIGIYKLYYATGNTFFGTRLLFGDETGYYSSDELLDFYAKKSNQMGYDTMMGHTVTLKLVYNGNFDTKSIQEWQFPKK